MYERIETWRAQNSSRIMDRARRKSDGVADVGLDRAHPRLLYVLLDQGSWYDQEEAQEMWAGLLVCCCTGDIRDESNLIFINLLAQMTINEIAMFNYACASADKIATPDGLIVADGLQCDLRFLRDISGVNDLHSLDRELDHMRMLGLFPFGIDADDNGLVADITPSTLALHMFSRCQGHTGSPVEYYANH
ncbi:MAG: hypothetical protein GX580_00520 [Candidatus Hydrogenedens sp.]|nr:hypothetical protein [Candidatus Hydrogenedens sp.]